MKKKSLLYATALLLTVVSTACAELKLPAIFCDHMVLQQQQDIPVWGWDIPATPVTVTLDNLQTKTTITDTCGKWTLSLDPVAADTKTHILTIKGTSKRILTDVLIGEVWLCSGQSNMAFPLGHTLTQATDVPKALAPQLRLFRVSGKTSHTPEPDVKGKWTLCTPATAQTFSAVAYYFGQNLRARYNRPVGLIGSYVGGTPAQAWTSLSGLQSNPSLQSYVKTWQQIDACYEKRVADYPAKKAAFDTKKEAWEEKYGETYTAALNTVTKQADEISLLAQEAPPRPIKPPGKPTLPVRPEGKYNSPTLLFNGMINGLIPYAIKGVIWYQGEGNSRHAEDYHLIFPNLITDWRRLWHQGDFPFLFVQLPACFSHADNNWPLIRNAQMQALTLPRTGLANAIDLGLPLNVHPPSKVDIAYRLFLQALHVAYGENIPATGPLFASKRQAGSALIVTFRETAGGLKIGTSPWVLPGVHDVPQDHIVGFKIAGTDKQWTDADAVIQGDTVILSSPKVPAPIAVRYAWENSPTCNLYNRANLPASPFQSE